MGAKNFPSSHLPRWAQAAFGPRKAWPADPLRPPSRRPDAAPHPSSAPFPLRWRRRGFLQTGEGRGTSQWIRSLQPNEKMPRIPLIKFPKRNLKAPSPSVPGAPSCFPPIILLFPRRISHELSKFPRCLLVAAASQPADQHATLMSRLGKHEIPLSPLQRALFMWICLASWFEYSVVGCHTGSYISISARAHWSVWLIASTLWHTPSVFIYMCIRFVLSQNLTGFIEKNNNIYDIKFVLLSPLWNTGWWCICWVV